MALKEGLDERRDKLAKMVGPRRWVGAGVPDRRRGGKAHERVDCQRSQVAGTLLVCWPCASASVVVALAVPPVPTSTPVRVVKRMTPVPGGC